MRSNNVLLVIVLIAVSISNACSFEFTKLAEVKALRSSNYGNSLIETISLTLQSAGSIDDVQKLLDDLLYKLNKDQEDADAAWTKLNEELTEKINTLTDEIAELDASIAKDEAEKKSYEAKRDQALVNLEQFNTQYSENVKALQINDQNRLNDQKDYEKSVQEHSDVIEAIRQVIDELDKLRGSVSGNKKFDHIEDIAAETRDRNFAAGQIAASFAQLTRDQTEAMIFAQMATKADQEALQKLIDLLVQLSDNTKKSLNEDEAHEARSVATHQSLTASLTQDNLNLQAVIKEQTGNLQAYVQRIQELAAKIAQETELRNSKQVEKEATIVERQNKEDQYNREKEERTQEKTVIQRLQKIVRERLANMSKFLRDNTGGF